MGLVSISNNKYEPPFKSNPRLIFFEDKNVLSFLIKLSAKKNARQKIIKYIINNLIFEKYNTEKNYFFVLFCVETCA